MDEVTPSSPRTRTKRVYAYWAIAFALLLALGMFCWLVVVPVWQVRKAAEHCDSVYEGRSGGDGLDPATEAVKKLGGPEATLGKVTLYLRMPRCLKPHRDMAAYMLQHCGEGAVPGLIELLKDEDSTVRLAAARVLGGTDDPRAVRALLATLGDEDSEARGAAACSLRDIGGSVVPEVIKALSSTNPEVRYLSAEILGDLKAAEAVEPLIARLRDPDRNVRTRAAMALGNVRSRRAVGPLISQLDDREWEPRGGAAHALVEIGKPAIPQLIGTLNDADKGLRAACAHVLGRIGDRQAVEPLLRLLKDNGPNVRISAAEALGTLADRRAEGPLEALLKDGDQRVREAAAEALKKIRGDRK